MFIWCQYECEAFLSSLGKALLEHCRGLDSISNNVTTLMCCVWSKSNSRHNLKATTQVM